MAQQSCCHPLRSQGQQGTKNCSAQALFLRRGFEVTASGMCASDGPFYDPSKQALSTGFSNPGSSHLPCADNFTITYVSVST